MFHGLTHECVYAAAHTIATFERGDGTSKVIRGTSFALMVMDKAVLVTNRHLVDLNFQRSDSKYAGFRLRDLVCEIKGRDNKDGAPGAARRLIVPTTHNEILFDPNPTNDVAVIFDLQSGNLDGSDERGWDYCFKYSDVATELEIRSEIQPYDFLALPGFPDGYDETGVRAIVRGGTIACDPRYDYNYASKDLGEILLYEGFSFGGSSGSPVIAIPKVPPINVDHHPDNKFRRLLVVGVNAGHIKAESGQHVGLSYFVRSSVIRRIIDRRLAI